MAGVFQVRMELTRSSLPQTPIDTFTCARWDVDR